MLLLALISSVCFHGVKPVLPSVCSDDADAGLAVVAASEAGLNVGTHALYSPRSAK